jgi:hypothetical protein
MLDNRVVERRQVKVAGGDHLYDPRNLPTEWRMWLQKTRKEPPTPEELAKYAVLLSSTMHVSRARPPAATAMPARQHSHAARMLPQVSSSSCSAAHACGGTGAGGGTAAGAAAEPAQAGSSSRRSGPGQVSARG